MLVDRIPVLLLPPSLSLAMNLNLDMNLQQDLSNLSHSIVESQSLATAVEVEANLITNNPLPHQHLLSSQPRKMTELTKMMKMIPNGTSHTQPHIHAIS